MPALHTKTAVLSFFMVARVLTHRSRSGVFAPGRPLEPADLGARAGAQGGSSSHRGGEQGAVGIVFLVLVARVVGTVALGVQPGLDGSGEVGDQLLHLLGRGCRHLDPANGVAAELGPGGEQVAARPRDAEDPLADGDVGQGFVNTGMLCDTPEPRRV